MAKLGAKSVAQLETCHEDLQRVVRLAVQRMPAYLDLTVLCGHRGKAEQNAAFASGASKKRWPQSKHNAEPSLAVDLAPYPIDWKDERAFAVLAGLMFAAASELGIALRWGGDWDRDGSTRDETFSDLPHFELILAARLAA